MATQSNTSKMWLSLWTVYLIWGSTYLAIAISVKTMPSLAAMGLRFLVASLLLALWIGFKQGWHELRITKREFWSTALLGGMLLGIGIGTVSLAERHVPSGIVALIIAAMPLWISLFRVIAGDRPTKLSWSGIAIGFIGVGLLLRPGQLKTPEGITSQQLFFWMLAVLFANLVWAFGTFMTPRFQTPKNSLMVTTVQMFAGGVALFTAGMIHGDSLRQFFHASAFSWFGWSYLVVIGSVIAYSAYLWLVGNAPVALTSTYAYVNPVIAVILVALVLSEPISLPMVIGASTVILGVILVITAESKAKSARL